MNCGDGPNGYAHNSKYQRDGVEQVKALISELISKTLPIQLGHSNVTSTNHIIFRVADLGCSIGSNTIKALQIILEAVENKYKSGSNGLIANSHHLPEFQLFFNDNVSNDFNALFRSLPLDRRYFVAGVPGTFHGRLFPKATIDIIHSSFALHWLSKVPEEVLDRKSDAWNGGRIFYADEGAKEAVMEAYFAQFSKDMECFLSARAIEMVDQGLLFLLFPGGRNEIHPSKSTLEVGLSSLGSCLNDMAKKGIFDQDKVDTFNLPFYIPSSQEVKNIVEKNGRFSIEMLQVVAHPSSFDHADYPRFLSLHIRAALEGIISKHFGDHIIDDLFERSPSRSFQPPKPILLPNARHRPLLSCAAAWLPVVFSVQQRAGAARLVVVRRLLRLQLFQQQFPATTAASPASSRCCCRRQGVVALAGVAA